MPQFPSPEWMDAFCDEFRAQPRAHEVAEVLHGTYRFVVEPAGPLTERHVYDLDIEPGDDAPRAERIEHDSSEPRLTLTAGYDRWRQLIQGKLDIGMAVMLRRLKIKGDLSPLVGGLSSAKPLLDALKSVDTQWLD
jgi:hypothetical protein